jgi:hypothetical protein
MLKQCFELVGSQADDVAGVSARDLDSDRGDAGLEPGYVINFEELLHLPTPWIQLVTTGARQFERDRDLGRGQS